VKLADALGALSELLDRMSVDYAVVGGLAASARPFLTMFTKVTY